MKKQQKPKGQEFQQGLGSDSVRPAENPTGEGASGISNREA